MGADGGINWMKLKKPESYKRLMELISIFPVTYWDNCHASGNDYFHSEWIQNHPELKTNSYLLGVYGSDVEGVPGLEDLQQIINEIENDSWSIYGIDPQIHTFFDLVEEEQTRPDWLNPSKNKIDGSNIVLRTIQYYHKTFDSVISIMNMKLKTWFDEVTSILDTTKITYVQTWT